MNGRTNQAGEFRCRREVAQAIKDDYTDFDDLHVFRLDGKPLGGLSTRHDFIASRFQIHAKNEARSAEAIFEVGDFLGMGELHSYLPYARPLDF